MIGELQTVACRELWVVRGKVPSGLWVFPVYIDYYQGNHKQFAKATPAVGLTAEQHLHLAYHFSVHNAWKKTDSFLIERCFLDQLAERITGIVPEYYFRWPNSASVPIARSLRRLLVPKDDVNDDGISEETEDFIDFIHKRRAVDRNILRLAIDLIAREAPYWLTQKKKPIDLGFVRLFAFPYRANWKEILLAKFRDIAWVFNSNKETKANALREAKFNEHLCRLEMLSIDRQKLHIHWTMEAVSTKQWEKDTAEIEMTKQASGESVYIKLYEKLVAALAPRILEVFTDYVQKVARAFPQIQRGVKSSSQKMVPYSGPAKLLPKIGHNIPVHIMVDTGPPKISKRERDSQLIVSPVDGLPPMPHLPKAIDDVRRCEERSTVAQPAHENNGDPRLLVPIDSQGESSEFKLLPLRPEQGDDSVANGA